MTKEIAKQVASFIFARAGLNEEDETWESFYYDDLVKRLQEKIG